MNWSASASVARWDRRWYRRQILAPEGRKRSHGRTMSVRITVGTYPPYEVVVGSGVLAEAHQAAAEVGWTWPQAPR